MLQSMKIEAETMFEKVMQTSQKTIQRRVQLNTKKSKRHNQIDVEKQLQKEAEQNTLGSSKIPTTGRARGWRGARRAFNYIQLIKLSLK